MGRRVFFVPCNQRWSAFNEAEGNHSVAFGYRARDEVYAFMANFMYIGGHAEYEKDAARRALDWAVVTKVLPKFHGPTEDIEAPLKALEGALEGKLPVPSRAKGEIAYLRHQMNRSAYVAYR